VNFELELPRGLGSAAVARRALDALDAKLPDDLLGDVRLMVSELVTNSLRHAELGDADAIRLAVGVSDATVRVEVSDPGKGFDPVEDVPTDPGRRTGWGLFLVETLADRWGVDRSRGTCVWFELDRVDAQAA
jgi:anti-sigma regulatory factor (Ser/Thr protein kinase)